MDQLASSKKSTATRLNASRIAKGYSIEDLAIATGLTVSEIAAAEGGRTHVGSDVACRPDRARLAVVGWSPLPED